MKRVFNLLVFGLVVFLTSVQGVTVAMAQAKDGSGFYGYKDTPVLPWCSYQAHDPDRPAPKRVDPGKAGEPVAHTDYEPDFEAWLERDRARGQGGIVLGEIAFFRKISLHLIVTVSTCT